MAFDLIKWSQSGGQVPNGLLDGSAQLGINHQAPPPPPPPSFLQRLSSLGNAAYNATNRAALSVTKNPANPAGQFFMNLAKTKNVAQAAKASNKASLKLVNNVLIDPAEAGISQTAAQLGHPTRIPSVLGIGGVDKQKSFTQNVAQAKGVGGKAGAVLEDVGNIAAAAPVAGEAARLGAKGVGATAKVVGKVSHDLGEVGAVGKDVRGAAEEPVHPVTGLPQSQHDFASKALGMSDKEILAAKDDPILTGKPHPSDAALHNEQEAARASVVRPESKAAYDGYKQAAQDDGAEVLTPQQLRQALKKGNARALEQNVNRNGASEDGKLSLPNPTPESKLAKATLSKGKLIERQSPEASQLMNRQLRGQAQYGAELKAAAKPFMKLSDKDAEQVVAAKEAGSAGVTKLTSQKQQQALQSLHDLLKPVADRAQKAGTLVGHQGDTYFPRMYDWSKLKSGSAAYNKTISDMVNKGYANDASDAIKSIEEMRGRDMAARRSGNLEIARELDLPNAPLLPAKKRLQLYLGSAARRVTQAEHFGADNERLRGLVAKAATDGKDAKTLHDAIELSLKPPHTSNLGRQVRGGFSAIRLSKAAVSHMFQTLNPAVRAGYLRTIKGAVQTLSSEDRAFARSAGALEDIHGISRQTGLEGVGGKITAPMLNQVMKFNRTVSALAGRNWARSLAANGSEKAIATLRGLGVEGKIGKTLTNQQELDAAYGLTRQTMFRSSPLDTPLWAETEGGKFVGQYRMAYGYKQGGFIFDQVLKEAAKGNIAPFLRLTAGMPLAGEGIIDAKDKISGKKRGNETIVRRLLEDAAEPVGLAGTTAKSVIYGVQHPDQLVNTVASTISPAAGEATNIVSKAGQALQGNSKPLEKYGLGLVPLVGSRLTQAIFPPASPGAIAWASTRSQIINNDLKGDTKAQDLFKSMTDKNVNPNTWDTASRAQDLLDHHNLITALAKLDKVGQKHGNPANPFFALSADQQKKVLLYQSAKALNESGQAYDKQGNSLFASLGLDQRWYSDYQVSEGNYFKQVQALGSGSGGGKAAPSTPFDYKPTDPHTQDVMNQYNQITDKHERFIFSLKHPEIQDYYNSKNVTQNERRKFIGLNPELSSSVQLTPKLRASLLAYEALPSGTGARTQFLGTHPEVEDYFNSLGGSSKGGSSSGSNNGQLVKANGKYYRVGGSNHTGLVALGQRKDGTMAYSSNPETVAKAQGERVQKIYDLINKRPNAPKNYSNISKLKSGVKKGGHAPSSTSIINAKAPVNVSSPAKGVKGQPIKKLKLRG